MMYSKKPSACCLCGNPSSITFHHLIPKTCHTNKWFKKKFTKHDMQTRGIFVCRKCHSFIHKKFTEKALGRDFNTFDKIACHEDIQRYITWAKKQY